jgi:hypothetical protein
MKMKPNTTALTRRARKAVYSNDEFTLREAAGVRTN